MRDKAKYVVSRGKEIPNGQLNFLPLQHEQEVLISAPTHVHVLLSKDGTVPVSVPLSVLGQFGSIFLVPRFFTVPKSYTK